MSDGNTILTNDDAGGNSTMAQRMNYIFFFPDELRAESMGCYGHPVVKTPNFDKLASEGVRFEQCHVQHTVCSPSRCSLMTGWYPHVSGHRTLWHLLRPHEPSLFRYLKNAGYHIEWHGKNDLYDGAYSGEIRSNVVQQPVKAAGKKGDPSLAPAPVETFLKQPLPNDTVTMDMQLLQNGIDFLKSHKTGDKPFMLFLPLVIPHPPYWDLEAYYDMYDPDRLPPLRPAGLAGKPDFHELIRKYRGLDKQPESLFRKIQAVYLGMIAHTDDLLGQLMEALEQSGLADSTTVIAASDHGDWAGDYGLVEKWPSGLDDTCTRVPLIIRSPGNKAGHVVSEQVELFDVMPTVLELAGIKAEHAHFARSLVPQLNGEPGDPDRAVFAEGGYDQREPNCFEGFPQRNDPMAAANTNPYYPKLKMQQECPESVCRSVMIRTLEYKLIYRTKGKNELYNLGEDPRELHNLYDNIDYAAIKVQLESRLLKWYLHTSDVVPFEEESRI
jgi:arylsulfatase A-like enzyme